MVPGAGLEPALRANLALTVYKAAFLPLEEPGSKLAVPQGIEPRPTDSEAVVQPIYDGTIKMAGSGGIEPPTWASKTRVIPLHQLPIKIWYRRPDSNW